MNNEAEKYEGALIYVAFLKGKEIPYNHELLNLSPGVEARDLGICVKEEDLETLNKEKFYDLVDRAKALVWEQVKAAKIL